MRLIVACRRCGRQYDASGRAVGSRVRCHCGETIAVEAPRGHDARVVRCSGCGAPREENAAACRYCGADFTIHDQDLETVCPGCLALVSDRARFCHHCGLALQPELAFGAETQLVCPACDGEHHLTSRRLGAERIAALECTHCAGLWLGSEAFDKLIERARHDALPPGHVLNASRAAVLTMAEPGTWRYRRCPVCRELMPRQNYARASGVIIDLCRGHGIWFDANELARILDWIRTGGPDRARGREAEPAGAESQARQAGESDAPGRTAAGRGADETGDAWHAMLGALGRLFEK